MLRRVYLGLILFVALASAAFGQQRGGGASLPDPFFFNDTIAIASKFLPFKATSATSSRSQTFNPAQKTLILIGAGQSNITNINPSLYLPVNSSAIDQFNIYDGGCYSITGPVLGTQTTISPGGPGNPLVRLADTLVTNGTFDRVIIIGIAVGGTLASDWSTGSLVDRIPATMRRLKARGFIPGTAGLTFAITWWQGESDNTGGTSQAAYRAAIQTVLANAQAAGFSGRFFINQETWSGGVTSATIRAAQASLANGSTIFLGGDLDTLGATYRLPDDTHLNDTGASSAAALVISGMHASGAPF